MNLQELAEKRKQLSFERQHLKDELAKNGKQLFHTAFCDFFEKYPDFRFMFRAYTVYFNDGDECNFSSTHFDYVYVQSKIDQEDLDDDEFEEEEWSVHSNPPQSTELFNILRQFNDDDILDIFGDHIQVVVSKEGVDVESYEDHD